MSAQDNPAPDLLQQGASLQDLEEAAAGCTACDLYRNATQTVFGDGPCPAEVMFVGEQPGNEEDLEGEPFIGPAGRLLDRALADAGIDRTRVYVTNMVKHFKWTPRGKLRLHKKPNQEEISACRPWLEAEVARVQPKVIVCLGATAAQGLLGRGFRVTKQRGERREWSGVTVVATVHPSSVLRSPDGQREANYEAFVSDLRVIAEQLQAA